MENLYSSFEVGDLDCQTAGVLTTNNVEVHRELRGREAPSQSLFHGVFKYFVAQLMSVSVPMAHNSSLSERTESVILDGRTRSLCAYCTEADDYENGAFT